jgi:3-mercaptopyruvate sulfurtransferase SseA
MKSRDIMVYVVCAAVAAALIVFSVRRMTKSPQPPAAQPVATAPQQAPDVSGVRRMPLADLQERLDRSEVTLIDVRDADSYIAGHIPGAIHIPLSYIEGEVRYLPRDKPIVTYCT